jgi:hypothetical protein
MLCGVVADTRFARSPVVPVLGKAGPVTNIAPGKVTLVEAEARRWEGYSQGTTATSGAAELSHQQDAVATAQAPGLGSIGMGAAAGGTASQAGHANDLATAIQLSPEQRRDAHSGIADHMAEGMNPAARAQLTDGRNLLEFAAANAPGGVVALDRPATPPADQITLPGMDRPSVEVSADPVFLRHWVEQTYLSQGLVGVDYLPDLVAERASDSYAIPSQRDFAMQRVIPALQHQIQIFKAEIDAFEHQFATAATKLVTDTLDESERVATAELAHYGIDVDTQTTMFRGPDDDPEMVTTTIVHGGDNAAAIDMTQAAAELAANQREIDRMRVRIHELRDVQDYRERGAPGAGAGAGAEPAPFVAPETLERAPDPEHLGMLLASLERLVAQAEHAHQERIAAHTEVYPLLASYRKTTGEDVGVDADALDRLQGSGRCQAIYDRIAPVLANIAATRAALGSRLNVWKEPRVVQLTMAQLLVAPGSLHGAMVERKIAAEQEGSWTDWAIMALSFGLAILTAIPTGGSSLVAGAVIAATITGAVTDVYLVVDHLRAYQLDAAKAGTDLDAQARAISAEQPSLFWLAFDIVATGIGLSAAAKTFGTVAKDLAKAEQLIATGARLSIEEADIAVARVHRCVREGQMSADAAERAEGKLRIAAEDEHGAEDVTRYSGDAAHDGEHGAPMRGRHDLRARVSPESVAQLEQRLGVPVVLDDTLSNGVELHYVTKRGALGIGSDIEPTVMRVGPSALIEDILAHRTTIARVTQYNGVVGKLRSLWDRIIVETGGINPFPRGSRGWASFEEMHKLDDLIELRRAGWNPKVLDAQTLDDGIAFLEGRRAYHEEIVRTAEETGALKDAGHIDAPDIGKVTEEAKAKGYKLPGADEGADPDWYYYRNKRNRPGEYELAVKPSAPEEAKSYRAVTEDGQFEKLEPGAAPRSLITAGWTDQQVIDHLWADKSFSGFGALLEREGLATHEEIATAIVAKSAHRRALGAVIEDTVRREVKDVFRPRLVKKLTDPSLGARASWQRMRQMLDRLENAERGNLAELWYQSRYAKGAEHHVAARVTRSGAKAGEVEERTIDLVEGNRAIEVKDVGGPIDKEQFKAYLDMVQNQTEVGLKDGETTIRRVTYVFTRPEGARANLGFLANELEKERIAKVLVIEVFDTAGTKHTITTAKKGRAVLARLGGRL